MVCCLSTKAHALYFVMQLHSMQYDLIASFIPYGELEISGSHDTSNFLSHP